VTTYQVVIGFVVAEPIETFANARLAAISTSVAAASGVDPSAVTTVAYAASTRVEITIVSPTSSASAAIEETLSTSIFRDANAASAFFGLQVTSAPTLTVETVTRLVAPIGVSAPTDESSKNLTTIIAAVVGGGLGLIAILGLCYSRCRGKGKAQSPARGRAQIGLGGASQTFPRGSAEMEDFSARKSSASIASATPRKAAKIAALNEMVEQSSIASNLIAWDELVMIEKLGEGTFGTVHACSFKATPCAVKQLRGDNEYSVQLLADMLREYDAMTGLRHPNVVLMLGIATDHVRRVGIVLERLEISLLELLHGGAEYQEYRTWRASLLSIASDVAKGVAYLHFKNVLHRDLKPGNVLLSDSWVAKVADFGSSANAKTSAIGDEALHGTPPYMAPEVARGENNQTAALDVWSFGCLLVHMGTLRPPYHALNCNRAMDIVRVVQRGDVSPVQVLLDDAERREYRCPASIVALAEHCCHREPTQRPDMAAIAGALVSPAIQTGIYKGAKETRPLLRLQRSRASVEGEGTFNASKATFYASKATYVATVAASSARGDAAKSPRSSPAYNASKSKFRNLSKNVPAGATCARGKPAPRAAPFGSAFESTFDGTAEAASNATFDGKDDAKLASFDRTFDGTAEAASNATFDGKDDAKLASFNRTFDGKAEGPADKNSIGLSARLARASIANLDDVKMSQRSQGPQRAAGYSRVRPVLDPRALEG
jgi:serine/threonine protein kinase